MTPGASTVYVHKTGIWNNLVIERSALNLKQMHCTYWGALLVLLFLLCNGMAGDAATRNAQRHLDELDDRVLHLHVAW